MSCLKYWDMNDLQGWGLSQKQFVNDFKWVEEISKFTEDFSKSYESDEVYFLEVYVQYPEKVHNFHNERLFSPKIMKIENVGKFVANSHDRT